MILEEKAGKIIQDIKTEKGSNPIIIFKHIASKEYISIHGPEHHILDGASLLVAFKNAGGDIDLEAALSKLMAEACFKDVRVIKDLAGNDRVVGGKLCLID